jgi:hypothetical protein
MTIVAPYLIIAAFAALKEATSCNLGLTNNYLDH